MSPLAVVLMVVILGTVAPVDSRFVKLNMTIMHPDETTQSDILQIDDQSFANMDLTLDQVASGYALDDEHGKIKEIVIGDKHIPVQFQLSESHFFSFITINNTYWIVSSNNFTNITVEDFEDDETLQPVELKLDWSFPRAGGPQPMTMVFSSPRHFDYTMIWLQQNQSFGTHQQPPQDTILSLRVVNPRTHLTTLTTYFSKDLIELELVETLRKLREGRVALLTAHSFFSSILGEPVKEFLSSMGSILAQHLMPQGTWAWAWLVNGPTLAEGLVANIKGAAYGRQPPPLHVETILPSTRQTDELLCTQWPDSWTKRLQFCELYDGYDDLCSCFAPFIVPKPFNITRPEAWHEELGVVIMASNRPRYLYRLLRQLMTQPGVALNQILVSVDGPEYLEAIKLVDLLGLKYQIHQPEGNYSPRISRHLRFALFKALKVLSVDKFIILEEDLILAPDFIMYMQQTSVLLDEDPSLYCVSAYSHFSFNHTAYDLTRLNRAHSFPAYGWMVKRSFLKETLPKWPPAYVAMDWDYWMGTGLVRRGREVVIPEVSRTAHSGITGAHFQGSNAKDIFLRRALSNHTDTVLNVTMMKKGDYEEEMKELLASATPLNITHLFSFSFPREEGVFAVCVQMLNNTDKTAFRLLTQYLDVWSYDEREGHFGLWRLPYYSSLILIVAVPYSKYSHGYLKEECPTLRATPSMAAFLDYDFLPKRDVMYMPEDFHNILGLALDSEENEIDLYNDYIDDSAPVEILENTARVSTLSPGDMNQDNAIFTEASTTLDIERGLTPHYTTNLSHQIIKNNQTTLVGGSSTFQTTENNQMSSYITSGTSIAELELKREITGNAEPVEGIIKTTERIHINLQNITITAKESL